MPRGTVGRWRRGGVPSGVTGTEDCPRCDRSLLDEGKYAYLLGLYLGDGWIARTRRGVYKLTIYCCDRYLHLLIECFDAVAATRENGADRVGFLSKDGCIHVSAYWKHWPCLFPQHGPGPKHRRRISLADWQEEIVTRYPDMLIRGLIHSDGWRGRNQGRGQNGKLYFYTRYEFTNNSDEIRALFRRCCELLGIECARTAWNRVAVSKRSSVAKMDAIVGPKT